MRYEDGFRKTSHKSRRGRWKRRPEGHKGHRKPIPNAYDKARAAERRHRLVELRSQDATGDDYDSTLYDLLEPSDLEDAA